MAAYDIKAKITGTGLGTFADDKVCSSIHLCERQCGEMYCSEKCKQAHWHQSHKLLCTGHAKEEDALVQFKIHAVRSNEIFLMVADMFAGVCCYVESQGLGLQGGPTGGPTGGCLEQQQAAASQLVESTFGSYVREQWWDAAVAPKNSDPQELTDALQVLVKDSYNFLSEALDIAGRGLSGVLTAELMSRTIGMFEQNNVGVQLRSPLQSFVSTLQAGSASTSHVSAAAQLISATLGNVGEEEEEDNGEWEHEYDSAYDNDDEEDEVAMEGDGDAMYCMEVGAFPGAKLTSSSSAAANSNKGDEGDTREKSTGDAALDNLHRLIEDDGFDTLFPPLDGVAFYRKICKINHSCEPNVRVIYKEHVPGAGVGLHAQMVSLKPIEEGEELVQSYIDQNMSFEKRKKALRDYGFECRCPKCQEGR